MAVRTNAPMGGMPQPQNPPPPSQPMVPTVGGNQQILGANADRRKGFSNFLENNIAPKPPTPSPSGGPMGSMQTQAQINPVAQAPQNRGGMNLGPMKPMGMPPPPQMPMRPPMNQGIGQAPMPQKGPPRRMADGGEVAPRFANINNQDHLLAYIRPDEAELLKGLGGAGTPGPAGIPQYGFFDWVKKTFGGGGSSSSSSGSGSSSSSSNNNRSTTGSSGYVSIDKMADEAMADTGQTYSWGGKEYNTSKELHDAMFSDKDDDKPKTTTTYTDTSNLAGISDASGVDYTSSGTDYSFLDPDPDEDYNLGTGATFNDTYEGGTVKVGGKKDNKPPPVYYDDQGNAHSSQSAANAANDKIREDAQRAAEEAAAAKAAAEAAEKKRKAAEAAEAARIAEERRIQEEARIAEEKRQNAIKIALEDDSSSTTTTSVPNVSGTSDSYTNQNAATNVAANRQQQLYGSGNQLFRDYRDQVANLSMMQNASAEDINRLAADTFERYITLNPELNQFEEGPSIQSIVQQELASDTSADQAATGSALGTQPNFSSILDLSDPTEEDPIGDLGLDLGYPDDGEDMTNEQLIAELQAKGLEDLRDDGDGSLPLSDLDAALAGTADKIRERENQVSAQEALELIRTGGRDPQDLPPIDPASVDREQLEYATMEAVKERVSKVEGTDDEGGYDRLFNRAEESQFDINPSEMTVQEILDFQQQRGEGSYAEYVKNLNPDGVISTPVGKYQVVGTTLQSLVDQGVISADDVFDIETQEKIGSYLIEGRGIFDDNLSPEEFEENLGKEFQGIANEGLSETDVSPSEEPSDTALGGAAQKEAIDNAVKMALGLGQETDTKTALANQLAQYPGSLNAAESKFLQEALKYYQNDTGFMDTLIGSAIKYGTLGLIDPNKFNQQQAERILNAYKNSGQFKYDTEDDAIDLVDQAALEELEALSAGAGQEPTVIGVVDTRSDEQKAEEDPRNVLSTVDDFLGGIFDPDGEDVLELPGNVGYSNTFDEDTGQGKVEEVDLREEDEELFPDDDDDDPVVEEEVDEGPDTGFTVGEDGEFICNTEGYIYSEELGQCIPDPDAEEEEGGGTVVRGDTGGSDVSVIRAAPERGGRIKRGSDSPEARSLGFADGGSVGLNKAADNLLRALQGAA